MNWLLTFLAFGFAATIGSALLYSWSLRRAALRRLDGLAAEAEDETSSTPASSSDGWLRRRLMLAGYRAPAAPARFIWSCVGTAAAGLLFGQIYRLFAQDALIDMTSTVPGGVGDVLGAVLAGGSFFLLVVTAMAPVLVVRASRRMRVAEIERDLPLVLELFATMAEAGLGFDGALARVVGSQRTTRPLIAELAGFQRDVLTGVPRVVALRRLAERTDVFSVASFTSAVIHAEQVGASMADTLRHQAESLRERRREQALLDAQAMPVKLVFPLVLCFLPGIFLSTLAPVLYQMIQVSNSMLRSSGR